VPGYEGGAQVLGDLTDEPDVAFGELFACRLLASDVLPLLSWEDVFAAA
jgi:hypothetical protein